MNKTGKTENQVLREIWLAIGGSFCRLFRVNTGRAYLSASGKPAIMLTGGDHGVATVKGKGVNISAGDMIIKSGRPITLGMASADNKPIKGSLDLQGFTIVEVTKEMIGKKLAIYTAIDAKESEGGKASKEQLKYCEFIEIFGGIAGIAASSQEAELIIKNWIEKNGGKLSTTPR